MQFGNRNTFAIELQPLAPRWERSYLPERSAWSALSIWVAGENLCRHVVEGEDQVQSAVNVPVAPLADWIARSWPFIEFEERPPVFPPDLSPAETLRRWGETPAPVDFDPDQWIDQRESWWARHFASAAADGAFIPNVGLVRSADWLSVEWLPTRAVGVRKIEFLSRSGRTLVPWSDAEEAMASFVAFAARWLRDENLSDLYEWVRRDDPLRDASGSFETALAAYTGRSLAELSRIAGATSPGGLRTGLGLREGATDPAGSAATQALRDLPPRLAPGLDEQLRAMERETRVPGGFEPQLRAAARDAAASMSSPEEAGYAAAAELRQQLAIGGQPIGDLERFLSEVSIRVHPSPVRCERERMIVGARREGSAVAVLNVTPRTSVAWGKRFELARGLGYLLLAPYRDGAIGGASSPYSQPWLRRCSGAFAAEFLLPTSAISEMNHSGLDRGAEPTEFEALMERFGVGGRTAAFQLWNHGFLSSTQVRDELIDRFASG